MRKFPWPTAYCKRDLFARERKKIVCACASRVFTISRALKTRFPHKFDAPSLCPEYFLLFSRPAFPAEILREIQSVVHVPLHPNITSTLATSTAASATITAEMNEYNTRKRKSRLAVFQRLSQREKKPNLKRTSFKNEPSDDVSELDLVIDDEDDCLPVRFFACKLGIDDNKCCVVYSEGVCWESI